MSAIDFLLAGPLAAVTLGGALFGGLGLVCARLWLGERLPAPGALPPVTFLRPIKAGVPALREKLGTLIAALRAGDQLVLGAAADSAELAICEAARREHADRDVVVVPCRPGAALNPKISKLVQMQPAARHAHLIVSDCEALLDAAWLEAFRGEWLASGAAVLTAPYRLTALLTRPQQCDAATLLLTLWPGLALVRQLSQVRITLGACTALLRDDLAAVGGWEAFGDFLAEDNRLGAALAAHGARVRLSVQVASLEADALTWAECWRHQRRVAVTYRVCDPRGFAGLLATHGITAAALMVVLAPASDAPSFWLAWAAVTLLARGAAAMGLAKMLRFPIPEYWRALLPAGLIETACWVLSWISPRIWWAGRCWRVSAAGRLELAENTANVGEKSP